MPDREDPTVAARLTLDPLLCSLYDALTAHDVSSRVVDELFDVAAEIYVAGHRDGVRHAVAEIAPEAERHGFRLWLPSELDEPPPPS